MRNSLGVRTIHTKQHKCLVALIRQERRARGLSQTAVAKRLRQTQPWYANLEAGQRRVDVVEYFAIAKAIGFEPFKVLRAVQKATIATRKKATARGPAARS